MSMVFGHQGALAVSSAVMSAGVSLSSVARTRLSTCSTEVALAIGAVTPGLAMTQASATSAGLALCSRRPSRARRGCETRAD